MKLLIFISFIVLTNFLSAQIFCEEYFEALKNNSDAATYKYNKRCIVQYRNYNGFIKNKKGRATEHEIYNDSGQIVNRTSVTILGRDSIEYLYGNSQLAYINYKERYGHYYDVFEIAYDNKNVNRTIIKCYNRHTHDTVLYDYIFKNDTEYERLIITKPNLLLATSTSKQSQIKIANYTSDTLVNIFDISGKKIFQLVNNDTAIRYLYGYSGLLETQKKFIYCSNFKYDSSSNLIEHIYLANNSLEGKIEYVYDDYNCLIEEKIYDGNNQLDIRILYDYENHGLINSSTTYNKKNRIIEYKKYYYSFLASRSLSK